MKFKFLQDLHPKLKHVEYLAYPVRKDGSLAPVIWVVRFDSERRPPYLRRSLDTDDPKIAIKKRDRVFNEWLGLDPLDECSWQQVHISLVAQRSPHLRPATIESMEYSWKRLEPFFGMVLVHRTTTNHWKDYCSLEKKNNPGRTFFDDWKHFNRLIHHALDSGLIRTKIKIECPKDPQPKSKVFSDSELEKLNKVAKRYMRVMIKMACPMGMRTREITALRKDQVDLKRMGITLTEADTKTKKGRWVPIPSKEISKALKAQMDANPESPFLFPSPEDPERPIHRSGHKSLWKITKRDAGVEGRFYDLRHTAATKMAKVMQPTIAAKILGHSLRMFAELYVKPGVEDLNAEMKKLNG